VKTNVRELDGHIEVGLRLNTDEFNAVYSVLIEYFFKSPNHTHKEIVNDLLTDLEIIEVTYNI
jgi:hypothetical protein